MFFPIRTKLGVEDHVVGEFWKGSYSTLTSPALEQFALHNFDAFRNREGATAKFESLDDGIRLDIAISPLGTLFVNEITRIWDADSFSYISMETSPEISDRTSPRLWRPTIHPLRKKAKMTKLALP